MSSPSFYAIIPAHVRYCLDLEANAKLLYGEITALCSVEGYCWASNGYFAELYGVDTRTIQRWIESLKKLKFISVELKKMGIETQRKIWISQEIQKMFTTRQKCHPPHDKNATHINTSSNTISPIVPKGDVAISSQNSPEKDRKKIKEEKQEKADRVFLTQSQHESLLKKATGDESLVKSWYETLSTWKIGKEVFGGKNDYGAINNWVVDSVANRSDSPTVMKEKNLDKDKKLAKDVENKCPHLIRSGELCIGNGYIEFILGRETDHIKFGEGGFRERVLNRLRKMNQNLDGL